MWPPSTIFAASVALLAVTWAAATQRTSPQFSFPAAQSQPSQTQSQFGADLFGANNQDLSLLSAGQSSPLNSAGQQQSAFVALGAPQQQSPSLGPLMPEPQFAPLPALPAQPSSQLVASSQLQQLQSQQPQQPRQEQPAAGQTIQLARPSLSLTSLSLPQQQQQTLSVRGAQSAGTHHHHQPARQSTSSSSTSSSSSTRSVSSVAAAAAAASSHHPSASNALSAGSATTQQRPAATNAAGNSNQHSVESARKFEATSASLAANSGQTFSCPDSFGFFRHHKSCDKYWACENGTATLKLCGNGLMFDDSDPKRENCAYPFSVDCGSDRTDLEPPISTPNCPRLYGLFSDNANCRVFYSCWNGEASKYECPPGLAYDAEQRVCVWADLVDRCDQSEVSDGFVCPDPTEADQPGHYTRHPHVTDCRKFYVCIEGVARPYGCSFGTVFNVDSLQCDEPENVSGCEKYYGDLDPKLAKKLARENAQGNPGSSGSSPSSRGSASTSNAPKETTAAAKS